jgi:hypothetical protein
LAKIKELTEMHKKKGMFDDLEQGNDKPKEEESKTQNK